MFPTYFPASRAASELASSDHNLGRTGNRSMQTDSSTAYTIAGAKRTRSWSLWAIVAFAGIWTIVSLPFGAHWALTKLGLLRPEHRVVILVSSDDAMSFGHAIAYSMNITRSYAAKNESVKIEIVANSAGIKLFRADTSPLQQELAMLRHDIPGIVFSMCAASKQIAERKEGHSIDLVAGARLVPFGIGRFLELQEAGWSSVNG
jgi:intracellular sulfur oxidation DsrE/DsrF family protein